jgi:hypothetical protein
VCPCVEKAAGLQSKINSRRVVRAESKTGENSVRISNYGFCLKVPFSAYNICSVTSKKPEVFDFAILICKFDRMVSQKKQ